MKGGRGIGVELGGTAYLSGVDLSGTSTGVRIAGGQATLWNCRIEAPLGHWAVDLEDGDLAVVRSVLSGNSPVLVGKRGTLELDDVQLRADTSWQLSPEVLARFQDVDVFGRTRIGQVPDLLRTHADRDTDSPGGLVVRWTTSPNFGSRVCGSQASRGEGSVPLSISAAFGSRWSANLVTGWKSGWLGGEQVFDGRDQTLARVQCRVLPFLEIGVEAGYGGSSFDWNPARSELAWGLLDLGMDLDEPFAAPGPLAGGRVRLLESWGSGVQVDGGLGYQWRGSSGSLDLGDLATVWLLADREHDGRREGLLFDAVYCFPDRVFGVEGPAHWQWNAMADRRRNLSHLEWGGELDLEGRDDRILGQRAVVDVLWGSGDLRVGPALGELVASGADSWTAAAGPGVRARFLPSNRLSVDATVWARAYRSLQDRYWLGTDASVKISGEF